MESSRSGALTALPLVVLAAVALLAITIRSEAGPGPLAAATPVPDAALKQECIEGAAVGSGNDGLAGDCALLLAAKDTLRGAERLNWSADTAIASWEGITVGGSPSRVTRLVLDRYSGRPYGRRLITLTGSIPAELGGLSKLEHLTLTRHELTGTIPAELAHLSELTDLQLHGNELTGGIPPELGNLSNLGRIGLSGNPLSGAIPIELGKLSNLRALSLENTQLTGSIPASLGDLPNLNILRLYGNTMLTGCIPASLRGITLNDLHSLGLAYCTTTATHALTTSVEGNGRISPLPGTYSYLDGATVTVTAAPAAGWSLVSWGDDCSTAGTATTCALTLDEDRTASVTFARVPRTLTVTAGEGGTVTHDGGETIHDGDEVTLTAAWNDATHDFGGWGGDCAGETSTCVLTMDANKTVTATFTELSATRCSMTNDANCIRAVYIGAPGDYRQVTDIPSAMLLSGGPGGTYRIDAGLEVTVVTAARLPEGWTRFYLDQDPVGDPPVSFSQLIKPIGTTYTFTVSDEAPAATTVTYDLKAAKPPVRPRPDGKPHIGATVVETEFEVKDCSSGIAVTNAATNTELVGDCESLLGLRDTIRGTAKLNWTAGKPMSEWMGVTVSGTPQRVTGLNLADLGLDGELSGLLGELTGLTTLNLSGDALTGMLPSKLGQLTNLTTVSLTGTDFEGCAPPVLRTAVTNDVTQTDCGAPLGLAEWLTVHMPAGAYTFPPHPDRPQPGVVFDIPPDSGLRFRGLAYISLNPDETRHVGPIGLFFTNAENTVSFGIDIYSMKELPRRFDDAFTSEGTASGYSKSEYDAIIDRIIESVWRGAE